MGPVINPSLNPRVLIQKEKLIVFLRFFSFVFAVVGHCDNSGSIELEELAHNRKARSEEQVWQQVFCLSKISFK